MFLLTFQMTQITDCDCGNILSFTSCSVARLLPCIVFVFCCSPPGFDPSWTAGIPRRVKDSPLWALRAIAREYKFVSGVKREGGRGVYLGSEVCVCVLVWGGWRWQWLQPVSCVSVQQNLEAAALWWVSPYLSFFCCSSSSPAFSFPYCHICFSVHQ